MTTVLKAEKREDTGKYANCALRAKGRIPCVIYGKAEETLPIAIDARELRQFVETGAPIVQVEIGGTVKDAIIKEVQYNTFMTEIMHADFSILHANEKTTVTVPVEVKGTAAGSLLGGMVELEMHEIHVLCLPRDIPTKVVVDIRELGLDGIITVGDLPLTGSITYPYPPKTAVVTCHAPKSHEEEEVVGEVAAVTGVEPEVIGKKKEDEADEKKK